MHASQLASLLASQSLFADCDADELSDVILRGQYAKFRKEDELMAQGEEGGSLYILLSGMARVSMVASNGREIILDYAEAGAVLGEIAFLDGGERTASVHAVGDVEALSLSRGAFRDIVSRHQGLALRLLQAMARRLRSANDVIESDRAYASGPRLARFLLRLMMTGKADAADAAEHGNVGQLKLALSQGELGSYAGMSREQINRQLSAWADTGIIEVKSGKVRIMDRDMLIEISESC